MKRIGLIIPETPVNKEVVTTATSENTKAATVEKNTTKKTSPKKK